MQTSHQTADSLWKMYLSLSPTDRKAVLKKFYEENELLEDSIDNQIADERKDGPFTSWEDVQAERNARRAA